MTLESQNEAAWSIMPQTTIREACERYGSHQAIPEQLRSVLPPSFADWRGLQLNDKLFMVHPEHSPLIAEQIAGRWVAMQAGERPS